MVGNLLATHLKLRAVAVDANPDFGTLGRLASDDRRCERSLADLLDDAERLNTAAELGAYVSVQSSHLPPPWRRDRFASIAIARSDEAITGQRECSSASRPPGPARFCVWTVASVSALGHSDPASWDATPLVAVHVSWAQAGRIAPTERCAAASPRGLKHRPAEQLQQMPPLHRRCRSWRIRSTASLPS